MDGFELFDEFKCIDENLLVIVILGYGMIEMAVGVICKGVYDFFEKLFKLDKLLLMVMWVLENSCLC